MYHVRILTTREKKHYLSPYNKSSRNQVGWIIDLNSVDLIFDIRNKYFKGTSRRIYII